MVMSWMVMTLGWLAMSAIADGENEDVLKDVEQRIVAAAEKHSSMTADVSMSAAWDETDIKVQVTKTGTYEYQRIKNMTRYRQELKIKGVETVGEEKTPFEQTETVVCDGRFIYTQTEEEGRTSAVKTGVDRRRTNRVDAAMFERLHEEYDLTLMPAIDVDGRSAYVIDAKANKSDESGTWRERFYFDKESGVMVRRESLDDKDKLVQTHEYKNVKLDVDIDASRFEYKPADDVTVEDRSKQTRGARQQPKKP
ncbi:MAG: hypothetical protein HOP29_12030 [Phycisphaerales bacterium]|nr:hypothetical protein [Phycisphaerales bacterium]